MHVVNYDPEPNSEQAYLERLHFGASEELVMLTNKLLTTTEYAKRKELYVDLIGQKKLIKLLEEELDNLTSKSIKEA